MTEIIPAILPESFDDLKDKMALVNGLTGIVQIDICDGKFVQSKSWPYIGDYDAMYGKIISEDEGFPFWESIDFEVDLMVKNPEEVVDNWIKAGAKRIVLHVESSKVLYAFLEEFRKKYGYYGESAFGAEIGIALDINTANENIYQYLEPNKEGRTLVDFVQFMGIDNIGYQNQSFDNTVFGKIHDLRQKYSGTIISIDGGVSLDNAKELVDNGVNRLISGSAVFESEDVKETIEEFRKI
jgi:ribulose-phosphate 3-epimerase